ncbi:acyl-CoA dehydrogenase family protein [Cupriavidus necator]|uniref:Acyl-CoA dehydrogenase n=1 Tax=Cupriavidus necator TaxID=106590 RepID=A0A367PHV2_CUPNE|nr:acyl-CoA dehydrogenase family protein [Cupriavidus necator]QQX82800.1 acyl-CoA dehydrogenase family protein [Cupriavidus necator]RCJ07461.1 acyl-CoA dehydrogenase [Cupriavidus necator]
MNLQLNDVQQQLQDSLERLLAREYDFAHRQQYVAAEAGHAPQVWAQLAELGVTAAAIDEAHGGFGGDAVDHMMISQALGKCQSLEPYHGTVVMSATAIGLAGSDAQRARLLPRIAQGELQVAWAHGEAVAGRVSTRASHDLDGWRVHGAKPCVLHCAGADYVVVTALVAGDGPQLFLIDPRAQGVRRDGYRLIDGTPAADLTFDGAPAWRVGGRHSSAVLQRVLDTGISAACAEMVGAMEGAYMLTVAYLKTRKQFGRLIGANQALQHRAVDMLAALEQSRSLSLSLALTLAGRNDLTGASVPSHAAKVFITQNARHVAQEAIQMHGGIGMTEEYAVGHYLRRILVLDQLHGDMQYHLGCLEGRPLE